MSYWTQLAASEYASSEWLRTHTGSANRPTPYPYPYPTPYPYPCTYSCGPTGVAGSDAYPTPLAPLAPPVGVSPVPTKPIPGTTWHRAPVVANPQHITVLHAAAGSEAHPAFQPNECTGTCANIAGALGADATAAGCASQHPGDAMSSCTPSRQDPKPDEELQHEVDVTGDSETSTNGNTAAETAGGSVVRHYTTDAAADSISKEGVLRPGSSGKTWLTPDEYASGAEARAKLALNKTPDGYYEIPMCRVQCPSGPSTVEPYYGQPGGGTEITTEYPIEVGDLPFIRFGGN